MNRFQFQTSAFFTVWVLTGAPGVTPVLYAGEEPTLPEIEIPYGENEEAGQLIQVNGIRLYVETYGKGPSVLLIHGNGGSIIEMRYQIKHFSKQYKVIVADSRGHGKSALGTKRLTYEQMAEDYNRVLERLNLRSVHIVGWSDGGNIGLLLAMKHPDKVNKLAIMGAALRPDGAYDWAPHGTQRDLSIVESKISQGDTSKPWNAIRQQLIMLLEQPNIPTFSLKAVKAPTLVMAGDRDIIRDEHTLEIFHSLPNAQCCIFPGSTHAIPQEDPNLFNQIVETFLQNPFHCPESEDFFDEPYYQ